MRVVLLVMTCCLLCATYARAQVAAVRGVVVDDADGVLPGATVVLAADGVNPRETTTDSAGAFRFARVDLGAYRLKVELAGFQPADVKLAVEASEPPPVRVRLTLGLSDEVMVKGDETGGVLSPSRNADAFEFDPEALRQFPTDMQNLQALIQTFTVGPVSFVVDGVETDAADIPQAAIYRLHINRNPYAVEYKSPGKSRAEIETNHGSRKYYHGSGALFVRNSALDSKNALAVTTPDMQRLLSEGTLGGPIPKKGWSFFASGQQLTSDDAAIISARTAAGAMTGNVPTTERRTMVLGRVDFRPRKTRALSLRYDLFDDLERGRGIGGLRLADQAYSTSERRQHVQLGDRRVLSSRLVNDLRADASHADRRDGALPAGPSIVVAGAFAAGPSQVFTANRSTSVQAGNVSTITIGAHAIRAGVRAKAKWTDAVDGSNFGGTFNFASLSDYASGRAALFTVRRGNPAVSFSDLDANVFTEIDFRPVDSLGVVAGVRYDWQSAIHDMNNVAPRVSFAYGPAGRTFVIRGGAGVFYQSLPETATARSLLSGAGGVQELAISAPSFPLPSSGAPFQSAGLIAWQLDPALDAPATVQASISIERPLTRKSIVSLEYLDVRGSGVFRSHDINAPAAGAVRPDAIRSNVNLIESTGSSRTNAMTATLRGRISEFKGSVQYVLSRTTDDSSGIFDLPADSHDFAAERGRADLDRRHRLNVAGTYAWKRDRIRLATRLTIASAAPFDITTGSDDNHDLILNDRPPGVTRNTGRGPDLAQVDLRFSTIFRAPRPRSADPESSKRDHVDNLELNLDVFNVLNAVDATTVVGVVTSPLFGRPVTVRPARSIQLSLRYRF